MEPKVVCIEPKVMWRRDGDSIAVQIVDPKSGRVVYQEFRSFKDVDLIFADVIKSMIVEGKSYRAKSMMTKVGEATNKAKREIAGKMDMWVVEAMMKSGVYPISYRISSLSHEHVFNFLRNKAVVEFGSFMISDFGDVFTILHPHGRVVVFPKDASKISVISHRAYKSAEIVLSHAYASKFRINLSEEVISVLSYYAVMYIALGQHPGLS
jgi:hypothetical protein